MNRERDSPSLKKAYSGSRDNRPSRITAQPKNPPFIVLIDN
jgi:hypothetical protein